MRSHAPASVWRNPIHFFAFGFGSGAAPVAPGTLGTLVAIPLYYWLLAPLGLIPYVLVLLATFVLGVWLCHRTSLDLGVHDHSGIVWDEFVGYWLAMLAIPVGPVWMLLGFLVFRVFDIAKPWPISWVDRRINGGFGIMLDDLLAGVYTWLVLQLLVWGWQAFG